MGEIATLEIAKLRTAFPALHQKFHEKPLVYLDSAATTQKPQCVIDAVADYYRNDNANVHRGIYALSERATIAYESSRHAVKSFINARRTHEVIFTHGTTEAINLIASCFRQSQIQAGDEIIISGMEHHSNIVPWQIVCKQSGATLKVIPVLDNGQLDLEAYAQLLTKRTKLVALIHVSNVLGTINPIKHMIQQAHALNIPVLVDGAQAVSHLPVDVQELDCDFYVFSAHKLYGPTGIGVLYGKTEWLEKLPPYQSGGDMIKMVTFEKTEYDGLPHKFEAGTPNMAGVIGLGAAIRFINEVGLEAIAHHEQALTDYAIAALQTVSGLRFIGDPDGKLSVLSFVMEQAHPHDIGTILDHEGIAIRAGHHCAMPLMQRFSVPATARASIALYNQKQDIDCLAAGLQKVADLFAAPH